MPYPLPDDVGGVSGLRYYLVAIPDDPTYSKAALGAYTDLGKYWKWGLEGPVPGDSDLAAAQWQEAIAETIRLIQMGFPDVLLGYIDEVETLLQGLQAFQQLANPCCGNIEAVGEVVTTDLDPTGDPPLTWGGEDVADTAEWQELVCGAAHAYVDLLKAMATELEQYVTLAVVTVSAIAGVLGILAGAGILLAVGYGTAAGIVSAIIAGATTGVFGDAADDIEAARAEIVCQVFEGDNASFAAAVEAAVSPLAWALFYSIVDYGSARSIMLEGSHGGETLTINPRSDCECGPDEIFPSVNTCEGTSLGSSQWSSELTGGCHRVDVILGEAALISLSIPAGEPGNCGGVNRYRMSNHTGGCPITAALTYNSNTAPVQEPARAFIVIGNASFTLEAHFYAP